MILAFYLSQLLDHRNSFLMGGNHEFRTSTTGHEFDRESGSDFSVSESFLHSFGQMPTITTLNFQIFSAYDWTEPRFTFPSQIIARTRSIDDFVSDRVKGLFWSDLSDSFEKFSASQRDIDFQYGQTAFVRFLSSVSLLKLVRGYKHLTKGRTSRLNKRLMNIFSTSNDRGSTRKRDFYHWNFCHRDRRNSWMHLMTDIVFHEGKNFSFQVTSGDFQEQWTYIKTGHCQSTDQKENEAQSSFQTDIILRFRAIGFESG
jgi:hypothetical protein